MHGHIEHSRAFLKDRVDIEHLEQQNRNEVAAEENGVDTKDV
jgi:hypothetical protein